MLTCHCHVPSQDAIKKKQLVLIHFSHVGFPILIRFQHSGRSIAITILSDHAHLYR